MNTEIRTISGFDARVLRNDYVEVVVVPALGAKIISLKDLRTGREWMWHPAAGLKLFANHPDDDFSLSPLTGIDECLPTIMPCTWQDRRLPDHGEVWSAAWQVDESAWARGILTTRVGLLVSPFEFERSLELSGNKIDFVYRLKNLSTTPEPYIWALHPLLALQEGDQLELPESTHQLLADGKANWRGPLNAAVPENDCVKTFAAPVQEARASIINIPRGERLQLNWNARENHALGLWLTRGAWHGHHHFAMEPTNAAANSLPEAVTLNQAGLVPSQGTTTWYLSIQVGAPVK